MTRPTKTAAAAAGPVPRRAARALSFPSMLAALLALASGCDRDQAQAGNARGPEAIPVTIEVVAEQAWSDVLEALGTVQAQESVEITAKVSETVQRVHFDSGDAVRAGAPLVTLSGQQQQAALAEAQAAANEAERLYRRQSELAEQQLVARAQLDTQRATRDATRARVAQVRAQLGDRTVRAPFAGVLGLRQVSPGALVTPGAVITTLDAIDRVYVDFAVPERALGSLAPGRRVQARSSAWPDLEFAGEVTNVGSRVDPSTRAVMVRAEFPNPDHRLRPGMLMDVQMYQPERRTLVVPEIAVVQVGQDSFVFRVGDDNTVERVVIEVGARRAGQAEILSGLQAGDRIVVDGTGKLRPGSVVVDPGAPRSGGAEAAGGDGAMPGDGGG